MNYLDIEYNQQIKRMEKLGINTNAQMFEQCVNTMLLMLENKNDPEKILHETQIKHKHRLALDLDKKQTAMVIDAINEALNKNIWYVK